MVLRIVIVGPGRVGSAFATRLAAAGVAVQGFVGRTDASAAAAVRASGAGKVLGWPDLQHAHVVLFTVGDGDLQDATKTAAMAAPRACCLWVHTSGRHDLSVFDGARHAGIRRGSLHPVAPIPDAAAGVRALAGAPALLDGDARSERLLRRLCRLIGLVPVWAPGVDRSTYHAACALAANGLTALRSLVDRTFAAAGRLDAAQRRLLADALMSAALRSSSLVGPAAALSGPVRRGDGETVAAHLEALARTVPEAQPAYRALMVAALELAIGAGLSEAAAAALRRTLDGHGRAR